jgi:ubiquinol-cytochrome c reductase cytochrome b/c1 subunit
MPIVGLVETPLRLPRSIAESVLGPSGGGAVSPAPSAAAPEKR